MSDRWIEAEFEAIFREHYQRIVRVIRRVLQRDSEAEEVCSEVFFRLYRSGPGVAASRLVGGWLYRTATRASIDALRADRRRGVEEQLEDNGSVETEDPTESPLALLVRRERVVEVRAVLAKLKVEKAQLLLLRHSGLSYREIAEALQLGVNSVGQKLARAGAEFSALYETTAKPEPQGTAIAGSKGGAMKHEEVNQGVLRAYLDGEPHSTRLFAVEQHLQGCRVCSGEVAILRNRAALVRDGLDRLPKLPDAVTSARAWSAFQKKREEWMDGDQNRWTLWQKSIPCRRMPRRRRSHFGADRSASSSMGGKPVGHFSRRAFHHTRDKPHYLEECGAAKQSVA